MIAHAALGGSTNAIIHLVAIAGRFGLKIPLEKFDEVSRRVPVLANVKPNGKYLMEDYHFAGGLPGLLSRLTDHLHLGCHTVTGRSLLENLSGAGICNDDVIRPLDEPVCSEGTTVVLRGNLAPRGAILKVSAADKSKLQHQGPAVVFSSMADLEARIDAPELDVQADSVLVLQNAGPIGGPGMPEWGQLPIPKKLLKAGVRDMVRISDSRMSGTAFGTCVLHVAPEAAADTVMPRAPPGVIGAQPHTNGHAALHQVEQGSPPIPLGRVLTGLQVKISFRLGLDQVNQRVVEELVDAFLHLLVQVLEVDARHV
ncbi:hypothetical protein CYMTET_56325 [Cymbomonas tetramitiformis]|uniref:Dihydroxy-acid dehydratase n=1 Tax=Cymbomonas tetramitiformis TaxID=36881 RepID=A0AAE0BCL1_9CHLO|nr:hypothetical protein CYMTET_56325 [Cymbomonas tetramitiformis]